MKYRLQNLQAAAAVILLFLFAVQAALSMRQKSVTVDEITYITAGYYHLKTGDFHYNSTNPPLMKTIAALPLLFLNPSLPRMPAETLERAAIDDWRYAREFLYNNRIDADTILFAARVPIVLLGVAMGLGIYLWSSALFGRWGGLLSLFLYTFSPNILAHTRLATQDVGLTVAVMAATFLCWRYTERPRLRTLVGAGLSLGLGVATKTTLLFTLPAFGLYVLFQMLKSPNFAVQRSLPFINFIPLSFPRTRQIYSLSWSGSIVGVLMVFSVNLAYGFQGTFEPLSTRIDSERLHRLDDGSDGPNSGAVTAALAMPVLLPSAYLDGLKYQRRLGRGASRVFFAGQIYEDGAWYLIFMTVLLKTSIPVLLLAGLAIGFLLYRGAQFNVEWLLLLVVAVYLFAFSYMAGFAGNLRYVLPVYPMLFILIGRLATEARRVRFSAIFLGSLVAWHAASSAAIYPHYLAYFNELIGGPSKGYKYLAESSLDWGQDLKGLKDYMNKRGLDRIRLGYFGSADARYYQIEYLYLPSVGLAPLEEEQKWWYEMDPKKAEPLRLDPGLVAVSANLISGPQWIGSLFGDIYAPIRNLEPIDSVGYSILIYELP